MALSAYTAPVPTPQIGSNGLTAHLVAAYAQLEQLTKAVNSLPLNRIIPGLYFIGDYIPAGQTVVTSAVWQAAYDAMPATGGELVFASHPYDITTKVFCRKPVSHRGFGMADTYDDLCATSIICNQNIDVVEVQSRGCTFHKMHFQTKGTDPNLTTPIKPTSGSPIKFNIQLPVPGRPGTTEDGQPRTPPAGNQTPGGHNDFGKVSGGFVVDQVSSWGFYDGIYTQNAMEWRITNCNLMACVRDYIHVENNVLPDGGDNKILNNFFSAELWESRAAIYQINSGGCIIAHNKVNARNYVRIKHAYLGELSDYDHGGTSVLIIGPNSFENTRNSAIKITGTFNLVEIIGVIAAPYGGDTAYIFDITGVKGLTVASNTFRGLNTPNVKQMSLNGCTDVTIGANTHTDFPLDANGNSVITYDQTNCTRVRNFDTQGSTDAPVGPTYEVTPYTESFASSLGIYKDYSAGSGRTIASSGLTLRPGVGVLDQAGSNHAAVISQKVYNFVGHSKAVKLDQVINQSDPNSVFFMWLGTANYGAAGNIGMAVQGGALYVQFGDAHNFNGQQIAYNAATMKYLRLSVSADGTAFTGEYSSDGTTYTAVPNATNIPLGNVSMSRVSSVLWAAQGSNGVDGNTALVSSVQFA